MSTDDIGPEPKVGQIWKDQFDSETYKIEHVLGTHVKMRSLTTHVLWTTTAASLHNDYKHIEG